MMVDRWRGILGSVDDGVAPRLDYRDFLSCFGIPVSEFQLTYRCGEERGEEIGWIHSPLLYI